MHCCVGEGRSQASPKGQKPARRAPRLLVFNTFPLRQIFPDEVTHFWVYEMTPPSKKNNETGVWQRIIFEAISLCLLPDFPSQVPSPEMLPYCISPNCKMYLSKIQIIFVQMYFSIGSYLKPCLLPDLPSQVPSPERLPRHGGENQ